MLKEPSIANHQSAAILLCLILLAQIGRPRRDGQPKPAIWIDGGIHAREWITPATTVYIIHQVIRVILHLCHLLAIDMMSRPSERDFKKTSIPDC